MLAQFEWVGISVHSRFKRHRDEMTARILRAMRHPLVNALNHPTGQPISRRPDYEVDLDAILRLAASVGVAIEINSQPDRLDLNDVWARRAKELGCRLVINSDAHSPGGFANLRYGIAVAEARLAEPRECAEYVAAGQADRRDPTQTAEGGVGIG